MRSRLAAQSPQRLSLPTGRSGLLAALTAVALALTLGGLVTALSTLWAAPLLRTGVYYGWTDGHAGRFQLLGTACPGVPDGRDAVVAAYLTRGTALVAFRPPAVAATAEALVFAEAVPVVSFAPPALATLVGGSKAAQTGALAERSEASVSRLTVSCRSHAAASARLGNAAVALIPRLPAVDDPAGNNPAGNDPAGSKPAASYPAVTGIGVTARPVPPASDLLGVLVLSNDTDEPLVVRALRYAPRGSATGVVRAAAGDRAMLAAWLGAVFGTPTGRSLAGTVDPAGLTPWDAAYQAPEDPAALRERNADDLDLRLLPGDMAIIAVDQRALARTLVTSPALLYPVLGYTGSPTGDDGSQIAWSGLTTPLYGATPAWRRRAPRRLLRSPVRPACATLSICRVVA